MNAGKYLSKVGGLLLLWSLSASLTAGCLNLNAKGLYKKSKLYHGSIQKYAKRYTVDAALIKAVMAVESCFQKTAVSPKNAQGLMQLIPDTAERFGVTNTFDADQNIRGGTKYLQVLLRRFQGDLIKALASYNAGEGTVERYKGVPPYKETRLYVEKVLNIYAKLSMKKMPNNLYRDYSGKLAFNKKGRVQASYASPFASSKPGRNGLLMNKLQAPHLYKQE